MKTAFLKSAVSGRWDRTQAKDAERGSEATSHPPRRRGNSLTGVLRAYLALLPEAAEILRGHEEKARQIPDTELRRQALASLHTKRFHGWGAAAMALGVSPERRTGYLCSVLALQTLADYLDNLVDRSQRRSVGDMRRLHRAMTDAVAGGASSEGYYTEGCGENVYLPFLVETVRTGIRNAGDPALGRDARRLLRPYAHLQVLKHIHPASLREHALMAWQDPRRHPRLLWWERAAGAGSTLPVFARVAEAYGDDEAKRWRTSWGEDVAALHILLDYAIDRDEDRLGGDYNLTGPGGSLGRLGRRLGMLSRRAVKGAGKGEARLVVAGLGGLYLTDPKALRLRFIPLTVRVLAGLGPVGVVSFVAAAGARILLLPRLRRRAEGLEEG